MRDDYFIVAAWILIPMLTGIILISFRSKTIILYTIVSVPLLGAIAVYGVLSQTLDGEGSTGASYAVLFFTIAFIGFQLGAGLVWLARRLKKESTKQP